MSRLFSKSSRPKEPTVYPTKAWLYDPVFDSAPEPNQENMQLQYGALSEENQEIRLLHIDTIEKESSLEKVQCTLRTVSLLTWPRYDALSYCWGAAHDPTDSLVVDGFERKVSRNLMEALKQLRRNLSGAALCIWVDSLCIDQANKLEKARQVRMMNRIFARAAHVWGWLGPASTQSWLVIDILHDLEKSGTLGDRLSPGVVRLLRDAFRPLTANPYWRRVWIIQELATARTLSLLWGPHKLSWELFSAMCSTADFRHVFEDQHLVSWNALQALDIFRKQEQNIFTTSKRTSLLEALVTSRCSLATESRDKIFALINMTSDGIDVLPFPNYTQDERDILRDIGTSMIARQCKTTAMLLSPRSNRKTGYLPSWMPDWTALDVHVPPWLHQALTGQDHNPRPRELSARDEILLVPGLFLAKILSVYPEAFHWIAAGPPTARDLTEVLASPRERLLFEFAHVELSRDPVKSTKAFFDEWRAENSRSAIFPTQTYQDEFLKSYLAMRTLLGAAAQRFQTGTAGGTPLFQGIRRLDEAGVQLAFAVSQGSPVFCVVHRDAADTDEVFYLYNCPLPVVLRPVSDQYRLVGEALPWAEMSRSYADWMSHVDESESTQHVAII